MYECVKKNDYYAKDSKSAAYSVADISKNGVAYFPFKEEKETMDWIETMTGEWWDDETI